VTLVSQVSQAVLPGHPAGSAALNVVHLAANPGFVAPGPNDFNLRDITGGDSIWYTKATLLLVLSFIVVVAVFRGSIARGAIVPGKLQFAGEQAYSFVRDGIARDIIGERDFKKYVPLLVAMFYFVLVNNLFGIIPLIQFPTFSRAGFAYGMAIMVWLLYNGIGVVRKGPVGYLKHQTVPSGVPWWILPLLIPLEFLSNILIRPVTLALRLFANMFAGHLLLLLFAGGADYLLFHATGPLVKPAGVFSFIMGFLVGFLELVVEVLQAYVFTLLTASYIAGALADEH
jgi:F-type H+-transporting ATPase subunit a